MICTSRVRDCLSLEVSYMYVKLLPFKVFTAYSSDVIIYDAKICQFLMLQGYQ